jgi:hypothetical protein
VTPYLKKGKKKRHIFIFVHSPPSGLVGCIQTSLPEEDKFFALLENYQATTCFFGDYHGYWRGVKRGVNLIISGGIGHLIHSKWAGFHHILRITVDQDKIAEEIITIPREVDWEDSFEEWAFLRLFPILENRSWVLYVV